MATKVKIEDQIEEITRLFEHDQQNFRLAEKPGDIPISYEAITAQWLTHAICSDIPGAAVTEFSLDTPDDGPAV